MTDTAVVETTRPGSSAENGQDASSHPTPSPASSPQESNTALEIEATSAIALASTKRKFYKLLEGLSKEPPTKSSTSTESAKRIRLEARSRLATPIFTSSLDKDNNIAAIPASKNPIIQAQLLKGRLLAKPRPKARNDAAGQIDQHSKGNAPNYTPWSHEQFLRRLSTFANVRQWTSKPDAVNEVQWARRGWICVETNTVACKGGCEQRVVVALRPVRRDAEGKEIENSEDWGVEVDESVVERFAQLIVDGHDTGCLWYSSGCKPDIYRLPIARPQIWQPQLSQRYTSFDSLPPTSLPCESSLINPLDMPRLLYSIGTDILHQSSATSSGPPAGTVVSAQTQSSTQNAANLHTKAIINQVTLALAMTGWTCSPDSTSSYPLATCGACFRRVGLWLFQPASKSTNPSSSNTADESKLDLLGSHRDYCPWVNGTSQSMLGSLAGLSGWEILERVVQNHASFKRSDLQRPGTAGSDSHDGDGMVTNRANDGAGANSSGDGAGGANIDTAGFSDSLEDAKPQRDVEKEDKARFARLKELTRSMGLKGMGLKGKTK